MRPASHSDVDDRSRAARGQLIAAGVMLFLCALPDAMVVPVLRQLMVDRYGVSVGAAHAFMSVNLLGALAVVGCVTALRQRFGPTGTVAGAALVNGVLLAVMALPIGFVATLIVRCVEGAADLIVYAVLFDVVARAGSASTRGRRMGAAATALMLGIAIGLAIGGLLGNRDPLLSLWFGALACLVVGSVAVFGCRRQGLGGAVGSSPDQVRRAGGIGPLWPAIVMMFSDRAVAGLLATTVPLYLASVMHLSPGAIGGLIGISMLMTAVGAWPAGLLADGIGALRLRALAGVVYAGGVGALVWAVWVHPVAAVVVLVLIGAAGAALFASSLVVVCQSHRGPAGMGAYHAAGNVGFLIGPLIAGAALTILDGAEPGPGAFVAVLLGFAIFHAAVTALTVIGASKARRTLASSSAMVQSRPGNEPVSQPNFGAGQPRAEAGSPLGPARR